MNPNPPLGEATPVALYDCANKALVAVFSSIMVTARYVFDSRSAAHMKSVSKYLKHKHRMVHNRFSRVVCFRYATKRQSELLGGGTHIILDEKFNVPFFVTLKYTP
jgi:hypothetical protein